MLGFASNLFPTLTVASFLGLELDAWCLIVIATTITAFATVGSIAQSLDYHTRMTELRVQTRRIRRGYMRERLRRLGQ